MSYIFGGLDNTGKSNACMEWAIKAQTPKKKAVYIDLENPRADILRKRLFPDESLEIRNCKVIYQKSDNIHRRGERDPIASYKAFEKTLLEVLDTFENYSVVVVDGISDIRSDYAEVWLQNYNLTHPNKKRKVIGKDPGAWGAINKMIYDRTIQPLQELSDVFDTTVLFTAKMRDEYKIVKDWEGNEDTAKTGVKQIDIDQDMRHNLNVICLMTSDESGKYYISVQKSREGIIPRKNITGESVYEYLVFEKGL